MAHKAAAAAGISEMISEYVLPVVAVMIVGALAQASRISIESVMRRIPCLMTAALPAPGDENKPQPLPVVAGGDGFSGITGSLSSEVSEGARARRYDDLAEIIRLGERARDDYDPTKAVRRILISILGFSTSPWIWLGRLQQWTLELFQTVFDRSRQ